MDFGFAFLSALFYYSIISQNTDSEAANFHVIEDKPRVDKLASKYANHKARWIVAIKNNISREKESGGICDVDPQMKVEFCGQFLPMVYFGYKFTDPVNEALLCKPNTFWIMKQKIFHIRRSKKVKEKHYQLEMYSCPDIFYRDLESDTDIILDERYYVSRGREHDSAIVFFQKYKNTNDNRIYPQKYIENIAFQRLLPQRRADANLLPQTHRPGFNLNPISIEEELIAYGRAIKLNKPYEKFQRTFFSMNICGQRKSHKVYLCRESIRDIYGLESELRFDQDYDDDKCKKRIKIKVAIWNNDNFTASTMGNNIMRSIKKSASFFKVSEVSLFFLLCPRMLPTNKNDFVYLASNLHQRSITFYMRTNDPADYFDMTFLVSQLNTDRIVEDNRRTRFRRYPLEIERRERLLESRRNYLQELEEMCNSTHSSVQTPTTIAKLDGNRLDKIADTPKQIQLIQKNRLVEDIVIKYSEIKTMKLPYNRFKTTHWSLDICELPRIVKKELCKNIVSKYPLDVPGVDPDELRTTESMVSNVGELIDDEIYYTPKEQDTDHGENGRCKKSQIRLGIREIENLKADSFQMWKCPEGRGGLGHMPTIYIAKCHIRNTALLFRIDDTSENSENNIYPDAVVTEIDHDSLALLVLADNFLHT